MSEKPIKAYWCRPPKDSPRADAYHLGRTIDDAIYEAGFTTLKEFRMEGMPDGWTLELVELSVKRTVSRKT